MKKCLKIINMRYLDYEGKQITVGGVQTYITNLAKVAKELEMNVEVFQFAEKDFVVQYNGITVHGVKTVMKQNFNKKSLLLYKHCVKSYDPDRDILLFGTDIMIPKFKVEYAIAIQHGIGWDIESDEPCSRFQNVICMLRQFRRSLIRTKCASNVRKMICVDYNYINWYRTQILHREMDYQVIPNFTEIPAENLSKFDTEGDISIIFARRLVKYRGTRLFADAIEKLLEEFNNLQITFAGDGPEENYLKNKFKSNANVRFITYNSEESLYIHENKHIAVIPTVGSEGTSLSLLEAMASTCAVLCTNVGGMTNIVIDNFNGTMINPDAGQLYFALKKMIEDAEYRKNIAHEAYRTVQKGFSFDVWKEKWKKVLMGC